MKKISDQAYLIMDKDSIEMSQNTLYEEGMSYYTLISQSSVEILTVEELVERTIEDSSFKANAHWCFEQYQDLTQFKFDNILPNHAFEAYPTSLIADFSKSFALHGFFDQPENSVNIVMDLDVEMDGEPNLPNDPQELLQNHELGSNSMISYTSAHLTKKDSLDLDNDSSLRERWIEFHNRLLSGKSHDAFLSKDIMSLILSGKVELPSESSLHWGVEYMAAKSKALPIHTSITETKNSLVEFRNVANQELAKSIEKLPDEVKIQKFNAYLQRNREFFVNRALAQAYNEWKTHDAHVIELLPEDLGISGRYDIGEWKIRDGSNAKFYYSPNINDTESLNNPWSRIIENFKQEIDKERLKENSLRSASLDTKTEKKDVKKTPQIQLPNQQQNPNTKTMIAGATALVGGGATFLSSGFFTPVAAIVVGAAALYYKYGIKKDEKKDEKKSR